jgi:hypothetical protein
MPAKKKENSSFSEIALVRLAVFFSVAKVDPRPPGQIKKTA